MTQAMRPRRPVWYIYVLYLTGLIGLAVAVGVSTAPKGEVQPQVRVIRTAEELYCPRPHAKVWHCTDSGPARAGPRGSYDACWPVGPSGGC